jgi:hypothetical protein
MSFSLNVLERWLVTVKDAPPEVRWLISAIHEYSHKNGDALNFDRQIRTAAAKLEEALDKLDKEKI